MYQMEWSIRLVWYKHVKAYGFRKLPNDGIAIDFWHFCLLFQYDGV